MSVVIATWLKQEVGKVRALLRLQFALATNGIQIFLVLYVEQSKTKAGDQVAAELLWFRDGLVTFENVVECNRRKHS